MKAIEIMEFASIALAVIVTAGWLWVFYVLPRGER